MLKEQSNKVPHNGILIAILTDQRLAQLSLGNPPETDGNRDLQLDRVQKVRGIGTLHPE